MTQPASVSSVSVPFGRGAWWIGGVALLLIGVVAHPSGLYAQRAPADSLVRPGADEPRAQSRADDEDALVERYRTARFRVLVRRVLGEQWRVPILPPRPLPVAVDSLTRPASSPDSARRADRSRPSFPLHDVRRVRDLERSWFRSQYRDVQWAFLGTGPRLSFLDTTRTRALRARLQAAYGDPTRTLAELYSNEWVRAPDSTRAEPIQFEYWFVVNDSLPVRVSDVDGPGGRGVIVSTTRRERDRLEALRAALLQPLHEAEPAPYVDYYYEDESRRWYRVGYDGRTFFRERISRFDIVPGRRPRLDTTRTGPSTSRAGGSSAP